MAYMDMRPCTGYGFLPLCPKQGYNLERICLNYIQGIAFTKGAIKLRICFWPK